MQPHFFSFVNGSKDSRNFALARCSSTPAELVYCPRGGQTGQQGRKVSHALMLTKLQSGNKSLLETIGSVRMIA